MYELDRRFVELPVSKVLKRAGKVTRTHWRHPASERRIKPGKSRVRSKVALTEAAAGFGEGKKRT